MNMLKTSILNSKLSQQRTLAVVLTSLPYGPSVRTVRTDRPYGRPYGPCVRTVRTNRLYGPSVRTVRTDRPYGPSVRSVRTDRPYANEKMRRPMKVRRPEVRNRNFYHLVDCRPLLMARPHMVMCPFMEPYIQSKMFSFRVLTAL